MHPIFGVAVSDNWQFAEDVTAEGWDPFNQEDGSRASKQSPSDKCWLPMTKLSCESRKISIDGYQLKKRVKKRRVPAGAHPRMRAVAELLINSYDQGLRSVKNMIKVNTSL